MGFSNRVMGVNESGNCVLYRAHPRAKPDKVVRVTQVGVAQANQLLSSFLKNHAGEFVNTEVSGSGNAVYIRVMNANKTMTLQYMPQGLQLVINTIYHRESDWSQECVDL